MTLTRPARSAPGLTRLSADSAAAVSGRPCTASANKRPVAIIRPVVGVVQGGRPVRSRWTGHNRSQLRASLHHCRRELP